jgi:phosphatidylserine decarboxylase
LSQHASANRNQDAPLPWYARPYVDLQYLLPHHALSALMYRLTRIRWALLKNLLIRRAIDLYSVDMSLAQEPDPERYNSFNAFFTRALRADARPLAQTPDAVLSPADGALSQAGEINADRIVQAKGRDYSALELLGGDGELSARFIGGTFATIYLSPRDYHRVHMPLAGELKKMLHVPGRLFAVNPTTTSLVPRLFARNERVVCLFESPAGPMALILVGAIFVGAIDTVWAGTVTPTRHRVSDWSYGQREKSVRLERGAEMGRFNMGSTVILLFGPGQVRWEKSLVPGATLKMGEQIGEITESAQISSSSGSL